MGSFLRREAQHARPVGVERCGSRAFRFGAIRVGTVRIGAIRVGAVRLLGAIRVGTIRLLGAMCYDGESSSGAWTPSGL